MNNEITLASQDLPAHLQGQEGIGRGNEDVAGHVTIPRLKLLQKMSALLWERDRRLRQYHDVAASLAHALRELHLQED